MSNKLPDLIGIGGTFASGKDSFARELEDRKFNHSSTSDMVRAVAKEKYGNIERETLRKTAIESREEFGAGIFVERALGFSLPLAISGIRTAGEVRALKKAGGIMVFVDADPRIRYERMIGRDRDNETKLTFEEFLTNEQKEISGAKTDADQNIAAVREMSDLYIENNGTLEEFIAKAISGLEKMSKNS